MIYVSTKSKRKSQNTKQKRELQASWDALCTKWAKETVTGSGRKSDSKLVSSNPSPNFRRTELDNAPSLSSGVGVAPKKEPMQYTGEAMIGIGQLHKSNAIPVFKQEDAEDLAKMRR